MLASSRGNSSVGRAQPCQGWGREFETRFPLQTLKKGKHKSSLSLFNFKFWLIAWCNHGAIAKRLCRGLQSRLGRFDSGSRLQFCEVRQRLFGFLLNWITRVKIRTALRRTTSKLQLDDIPPARVVKLVDTRDLKSLARKGVPVRFRPRAPFLCLLMCQFVSKSINFNKL